MIVYHGTTEIIKTPDVLHSKGYIDFGPGFYVTTYEEQAKKWAARKGMRQNKEAIVNVYYMEEKLDEYKKNARKVYGCMSDIASLEQRAGELYSNAHFDSEISSYE